MYRITRISVCIVAAVAVMSCIKLNEQTELNEGVELTVTAVREGCSPDTKTVRLEDGSVVWSPVDKISLFYGKGTNGGSIFTSQNTELTSLAEFKGRLDGVSGGGELYVGNNYFWGVYPYSASNACDGNTVTTTLPAFQTAEEGTFASNLFPTIARSKGLELAFYNICGGVKFSVSRSDITSVRFKGNSGENLAGTFKVKFNETGKPEVTEVEGGKNEVTVSAPGGGTFEAGKYYYIVLLPTQLSGGFTMTFRTAEMKEGIYVRTDDIAVERSTFGVLNKPDANVKVWDDAAMTSGGDHNGIYLGITGFNQSLYSYPIGILSDESKNGFNEFIDGLSMKNGTLLYYSVDQAITTLQSTPFPDDLFNVAIVTFTDGLDQGSMMMKSSYGTDEAYLDAVNMRLKTEKVSGQEISAYSIGVRGRDVSDISKFQNNLKKLATAPENSYEVSNMDELNATFQSIAGQLDETSFVQKVSLRIPGQADGTKIRFTFDNITSVDKSELYVEGTFNLKDRSLTNVEYHGLSSKSGSTIKGVVEGIFVTLTIDGIRVENKSSISKDYIQQWSYINSTASWQINSEFDKDENADVVNEKRSAAIMLVLDCSSSLSSDFVTVQQHAKSFIATLCAPQTELNPDDPVAHPSDHYSTTPLDLSLAVVRDSVRYYVTREQYTDLNKDAYIVEGLAVVTGGEQFIIALNNASANTMTWEMANALYDLPNQDQGKVISARFTDVSNALKAFNGSGISTSTGYWTSYASGGNNYYIYSSGGTLSSTSSSGSHYSVREVFTIEPGRISIHAAPANDLSLAVSNGQDRLFISKETYLQNGIPSGYTAEGVVVLSRWGDFIVSLKNVSSDAMTFQTALQLYGNALPSYYQGKVISARLADINNALKSFGGVSVSTSTGYWTSYAPNGYNYYIYSGGGVLTSTGSTTARYYVRLIADRLNDPYAVEGVDLDYSSLALVVGEGQQLSAGFRPDNAANKFLKWSSSDPSVVSVDDNGLLTTWRTGSATITVTTVDGNKTAQCDVSVKEWGAIDLGLSVKWSNRNLGALMPEECGDFYAWGETETKSDYSWETYKWGSSSDSFTKYTNADGKKVLDAEDDAAHVKLGGKWRMPTSEEWTELRTQCTWIWTNRSGVYGKLVKSLNGKNIFLPASGTRESSDNYLIGDSGLYWSSSSEDNNAYYMNFYSSYCGQSSRTRCYGLSVRPVTE